MTMCRREIEKRFFQIYRTEEEEGRKGGGREGERGGEK